MMSQALSPRARRPFNTGVFRASVELVCQDPPASLDSFSYREVVADDAFVAGFAWGE